MTTAPPMPLWKIISFFIVIAMITSLIVCFMHYPIAMTTSMQSCGVFIFFLILNFIIPDKKTSANTNSNWQHRLTSIFFWVIFTELFIFILSDNFSAFAFDFSSQTKPSDTSLLTWPIWLGLWAYFSVTLTMQHYAYYCLHQSSITSGLLFHFKNTYLDIALRRAFLFVNLGTNLTAIFLLWISIIFIIINYIHPEAINHFYLFSLVPFIFFFFFSSLTKTPKIKQWLTQGNHSNFFYLMIAGIFCTAAILASTAFSSYSFVIKHSFVDHHHYPLLFISLFIVLAPLFTSLIVKKSAHISRKKLLLISFLTPNLFHFPLLTKTLENKGVFMVITLTFFVVLLKGNTTSNFLTGILPIPKQRAILLTKSYMLFSSYCLVMFMFYLLVVVIGPIILYSLTVSAASIAALMGTIGMMSYFGKSYRDRKIN